MEDLGILSHGHVPFNDHVIEMQINLGTKHDMIGLMDTWDPSQGDPMSFAKSIFPNTFEAVELLKVQAHSMVLPGHGEFGITLFVHHAKCRPSSKKGEQIRKVKGGYTGAIQVYRTDIMNGQTEMPTNLIYGDIRAQLDEQIRLLKIKIGVQN